MYSPYLGREDPLEEDMATHSSILAWRIPWTEVHFQDSIKVFLNPLVENLAYLKFWMIYVKEILELSVCQ